MIAKAKQSIARTALEPIFKAVCSFSYEDRIDISSEEGFERILFRSGDGCELDGYIYKAPGQSCNQGTCFYRHGFSENCTKPWILEKVKELSRKFNITVVSFDSRYHGWSSQGPYFPTFGAAEAFDIQAAMDLSDQKKLQQPFFMYGVSLGAMASQRAGIVDSRVKGLFLISPPAWPWDAVGVSLQTWVMAGNWINHSYMWDILTSGDIRLHPQLEGHRPLVCYIMGDQDHYNISHTIEVFDHWYQGEAGNFHDLPHDSQDCWKFFRVLQGIGHPGPENDLGSMQGYQEYEESFFKRMFLL